MKIDIYALALITDIYGAFWLAKGIIWRSRRQIELETTTFYDGNPYQKAGQIETFFYGWYGFIFLAIGFIGQIISQNFEKVIQFKYFIIYIAFLIVLNIAYIKLIKVKSNKEIPKEVVKKHGKY
ncbi:MAG: hypothetical protein ACD_7C00489G0003 [uncultured bacterium]|nr:MAG: hypothetical protein ACD_7C00489G0003 [uncultured bacterium]